MEKNAKYPEQSCLLALMTADTNKRETHSSRQRKWCWCRKFTELLENSSKEKS